MTMHDSGINYTESRETFLRNPGRGYTPYPWIVCKTGGKTRTLDEEYFTRMGLSTPMYDFSAFSSGNGRQNNTADPHADHYESTSENPDRVGGVNRDIDEATLAAIEGTMRAARAQGVQLIPRFSYAWDASIGCEPDDINVIFRHIDQISDVVNRYSDTVIAVEGGIFGPWGEMHSSIYCAPELSSRIIAHWLERLDEKIGLLVRNFGYFSYLLGVDVDAFKAMWPLKPGNPAYRMGLYNDGYLGTGVDTGTFDLPSDPETVLLKRPSAVRFMSSQNERLPYGGDIAYTSIGWIKGENDPIIPPSPIYDDGFVKEMYDTHLSYLRNIIGGPTVVKELAKIKLSERHVFDGMPDVSAYMGEGLDKFILDHLGYRFVLRDAQSGRDGNTAVFSGKIENTGFGNALRPLCAELILISGDRTVIQPAGIDLTDFPTRRVSEYRITAGLPADMSGSVRAYLRFGSTPYKDAAKGACTVLFANEGIHSEKYGANFIGEC